MQGFAFPPVRGAREEVPRRAADRGPVLLLVVLGRVSGACAVRTGRHAERIEREYDPGHGRAPGPVPDPGP
ncbi:hypothetical protein GCM10007079_44970 [Nocardiopsis terrae]|nr:hypothetical protein GCM10007079_44970 [Nocardiopsis terrae]